MEMLLNLFFVFITFLIYHPLEFIVNALNGSHLPRANKKLNYEINKETKIVRILQE